MPFPVTIRNAVPVHRRFPARFCTSCYVERSAIEQLSDDELGGKCQDCHDGRA